ncbi:hypothetical protein O181_009793 [Austropuccinia psidii MF-1]|uniref:RlpA-like protein double-psi beta-barrel domain-containing protein n=1 Tax=Austropuccinia psidii MF-1 TaxID=1389203 RepID=A0A9Q3GJS0_9BASI|nr:hypothetical protein [Austropuccinia psidii MF-1]
MIRILLKTLLVLVILATHIFATPSNKPNKLKKRYSGQATWFMPDTGACGDVNSEFDYIVAMNHKQYGQGEPCHKKVKITNTLNGRTVTAMVTDECPPCGFGSLDLSPSVFKVLGALDIGVLPIIWEWA